MAAPDPKELAHSFLGHMVAHPQLLQEFKALKPSTAAGAPAGAKGAEDVAKLIRDHLGIDASANDAKAMGPHLAQVARSIQQAAPNCGVDSTIFNNDCVFGRGN